VRRLTSKTPRQRSNVRIRTAGGKEKLTAKPSFFIVPNNDNNIGTGVETNPSTQVPTKVPDSTTLSIQSSPGRSGGGGSKHSRTESTSIVVTADQNQEDQQQQQHRAPPPHPNLINLLEDPNNNSTSAGTGRQRLDKNTADITMCVSLDVGTASSSNPPSPSTALGVGGGGNSTKNNNNNSKNDENDQHQHQQQQQQPPTNNNNSNNGNTNNNPYASFASLLPQNTTTNFESFIAGTGGNALLAIGGTKAFQAPEVLLAEYVLGSPPASPQTSAAMSPNDSVNNSNNNMSIHKKSDRGFNSNSFPKRNHHHHHQHGQSKEKSSVEEANSNKTHQHLFDEHYCSDVYQLGLTLYCALFGCLPFSISDPNLYVDSILREGAPFPPTWTQELNQQQREWVDSNTRRERRNDNNDDDQPILHQSPSLPVVAAAAGVIVEDDGLDDEDENSVTTNDDGVVASGGILDQHHQSENDINHNNNPASILAMDSSAAASMGPSSFGQTLARIPSDVGEKDNKKNDEKNHGNTKKDADHDKRNNDAGYFKYQLEQLLKQMMHPDPLERIDIENARLKFKKLDLLIAKQQTSDHY